MTVQIVSSVYKVVWNGEERRQFGKKRENARRSALERVKRSEDEEIKGIFREKEGKWRGK